MEPIFQMCMQEVKVNYQKELPQQLNKSSNQINELHPQPSPLLLKRLIPFPHPHPQPSLLLPQIENKMISQIKEQHPLLPSLVLLHPH